MEEPLWDGGGRNVCGSPDGGVTMETLQHMNMVVVMSRVRDEEPLFSSNPIILRQTETRTSLVPL